MSNYKAQDFDLGETVFINGGVIKAAVVILHPKTNELTVQTSDGKRKQLPVSKVMKMRGGSGSKGCGC